MSMIIDIDPKEYSTYTEPEGLDAMSPVVSAKSETKRLFESDFLEFFTRVHWSVPLILYIPLISFCLYQGLKDPLTNWSLFVGTLLLALLVWSVTEYLLHRFFFHFKPKNKKVQKLFYLIHEVHHEYPSDPLRLVMPPIESIPLAIVLFWGLRTLLPNPFFYPSFMGFVIGYLIYDMIHYSSHHFKMKGPIGQYLKQYHLKHHFQEEERGFGVSSPLWDLVFRTKYSVNPNN